MSKENKIDKSRSSGTSNFKGLKQFREREREREFPFSPPHSSKNTKGGYSCRVKLHVLAKVNKDKKKLRTRTRPISCHLD